MPTIGNVNEVWESEKVSLRNMYVSTEVWTKSRSFPWRRKEVTKATSIRGNSMCRSPTVEWSRAWHVEDLKKGSVTETREQAAEWEDTSKVGNKTDRPG